MSPIIVMFAVGAALRGLDDYILVPLFSEWARVGLLISMIGAGGALVSVFGGASIEKIDGGDAESGERRTVAFMAFALPAGYGLATLLLAAWSGYQGRQ